MSQQTPADAVHVGCKRLRALLAHPDLDRREAEFVVDHMEAQFAARSAAKPEPAPEPAVPRITVTSTTRWP